MKGAQKAGEGESKSTRKIPGRGGIYKKWTRIRVEEGPTVFQGGGLKLYITGGAGRENSVREETPTSISKANSGGKGRKATQGKHNLGKERKIPFIIWKNASTEWKG